MKLELLKISGVVLILAVAVMMGCKDDTATPTTAKFRGTITFENTELWETWQDSGEIQVTFFPEFSLDPPAGWGETPGGTFAIGAPVNAQDPLVIDIEPGIDQYSFEFNFTNYTEETTFSALAAGFRHDFIVDPSKRTATVGVYWDNPNEVSHGIVIQPFFDYPAPESFTLKPGDDLVLDFKADLGFLEVWPFR